MGHPIHLVYALVQTRIMGNLRWSCWAGLQLLCNHQSRKTRFVIFFLNIFSFNIQQRYFIYNGILRLPSLFYYLLSFTIYSFLFQLIDYMKFTGIWIRRRTLLILYLEVLSPWCLVCCTSMKNKSHMMQNKVLLIMYILGKYPYMLL